MPDSDGRLKGEGLTAEAIREVAREVDDLETQGHVVLSGPSSVQLVLKVDDALTPQEAVELVIHRIAHVGLDTFTFAVTDMLTGEDHFVQAGQLIDLEQLQSAIVKDERVD